MADLAKFLGAAALAVSMLAGGLVHAEPMRAAEERSGSGSLTALLEDQGFDPVWLGPEVEPDAAWVGVRGFTVIEVLGDGELLGLRAMVRDEDGVRQFYETIAENEAALPGVWGAMGALLTELYGQEGPDASVEEEITPGRWLTLALRGGSLIVTIGARALPWPLGTDPIPRGIIRSAESLGDGLELVNPSDHFSSGTPFVMRADLPGTVGALGTTWRVLRQEGAAGRIVLSWEQEVDPSWTTMTTGPIEELGAGTYVARLYVGSELVAEGWVAVGDDPTPAEPSPSPSPDAEAAARLAEVVAGLGVEPARIERFARRQVTRVGRLISREVRAQATTGLPQRLCVRLEEKPSGIKYLVLHPEGEVKPSVRLTDGMQLCMSGNDGGPLGQTVIAIDVIDAGDAQIGSFKLQLSGEISDRIRYVVAGEATATTDYVPATGPTQATEVASDGSPAMFDLGDTQVVVAASIKDTDLVLAMSPVRDR